MPKRTSIIARFCERLKITAHSQITDVLETHKSTYLPNALTMAKKPVCGHVHSGADQEGASGPGSLHTSKLFLSKCVSCVMCVFLCLSPFTYTHIPIISFSPYFPYAEKVEEEAITLFYRVSFACKSLLSPFSSLNLPFNEFSLIY